MVRTHEDKSWLPSGSRRAWALGAAVALTHCSLIPGSVRVPLGGSSAGSSATSSTSSGESSASARTASAQSSESARLSQPQASNAQTAPAAPQPPQRYAGMLTVVNRSSVPLCDVQVIERGGSPSTERHVDGPVAPGAEVSVRVTRNASALFASACDAQRSLLGRPTEYNLSELSAPRVVVQDAGGAEQSSAAQLVLAVNPIEPAQWIDHALQTELRSLPPNLMRDAALERTLTGVMVDHARAERWSETFEAARLASVEFEVIRGRFSGVPELRKVNALVGARWPDGHCSLQGFLFSQQHNGARFTGPWQHAGTGGQLTVPCVVLRSMAPRAAR